MWQNIQIYMTIWRLAVVVRWEWESWNVILTLFMRNVVCYECHSSMFGAVTAMPSRNHSSTWTETQMTQFLFSESNYLHHSDPYSWYLFLSPIFLLNLALFPLSGTHNSAAYLWRKVFRMSKFAIKMKIKRKARGAWKVVENCVWGISVSFYIVDFKLNSIFAEKEAKVINQHEINVNEWHALSHQQNEYFREWRLGDGSGMFDAESLSRLRAAAQRTFNFARNESF